ncbi:MAG: YegP family protein [Coriobacteriia bacterium]|nr:YegP family protein [Coriobacteriia bacterium]
MGKFAVYVSEKGARFNLKAGNGEVIATSQMYKSQKSCLAGVESVRKNAPIAALENQTIEDFEPCKHPKFEVYTDKAGKARFRLKAKNGKIIAVSQGYKTVKSCLSGIESVRKNAADSPVVEQAEE